MHVPLTASCHSPAPAAAAAAAAAGTLGKIHRLCAFMEELQAMQSLLTDCAVDPCCCCCCCCCHPHTTFPHNRLRELVEQVRALQHV
jgi:hypothetical protein